MVKEVWYQSHDFDSTDLGPLGCAEALEYLAGVNWPREWQREAEKVAAREQCCPAGMGFRAADGPFIHLMPTPEGVTVLFEWDEPAKFLGIFSIMKHRDVWVEKFPNSEVPTLLGQFYAADYPAIRQRLGKS
jgi:hypothetical protein